MKQEYSQEILDLCLNINLSRLAVSLREREKGYRETEQNSREENIEGILRVSGFDGRIDFLV